MTGQLLPPVSDDRLDRLIDQILADRAEDVASAVLPADAMAERIALQVRPAYASRAGLVLVAVLGLLLVGIVAAAVIGSRPPAPPPTPTSFICEAKAPEFDGELPYPIAVQDETGTFKGCRQITAEAATALRDAFGLPLDVLYSTSAEITKANAEGTHLLVVWMIVGCDEGAEVDLTAAPPDRIELVVSKRQVGPCPPGSGLVAIELISDQPVSPAKMAGRAILVPSGP